MGTPHAGSHVTDAARVKMLKALARATFKKAPENLIRALSAHSNELQDLSASFERTTIFTQHMIEICTYFETKTTKFVGEEASFLASRPWIFSLANPISPGGSSSHDLASLPE